ncbi:guanine deaminase [Apiospora arundinis]|uniref:Guanine deaminase n=1 Tax=Apiospora arundinis TaxID=335852 RepID=A0ABR2IUQ3_9PEZI
MTPPALHKNQLFVGTFVHSKSLSQLHYLHDASVAVDKSGKIVAIEPQCGHQEKAAELLYPKLGWDAADVEVRTCKEGQFFFPGFIDTHIHAPQYPNAGIFGNSTLLDWLDKYTFPMEASLAALPRARRVYSQVVRRTLSHGTTAAAYYATIDVAATNLLADLCLAAGQRAFVGRVCMDRLAPDYYVDEGGPDAVLSRTRETITHMRQIDPAGDIVAPILTPRFAPACTPETMAKLGDLARAEDLRVQTHISENVGEMALVREHFPDAANYASVYDKFGLLTPRTVLAHAVHLTESEAALIKQRGAKVAHCPCSNSCLTSGECPVRWLLDRGVDVGLGTDVSGGYSSSVLEAARLACLVSRHLAMPYNAQGDAARAPSDIKDKERERAKLSIEEALHLATRGGATVLGLEHKVGGFEVGMEWDAQLIGLHMVDEGNNGVVDVENSSGGGVIEAGADEGNVDIFGWETWDERIAKWVYNGDDRNTKLVWVKGRLVHQRSSSTFSS